MKDHSKPFNAGITKVNEIPVVKTITINTYNQKI